MKSLAATRICHYSPLKDTQYIYKILLSCEVNRSLVIISKEKGHIIELRQVSISPFFRYRPGHVRQVSISPFFHYRPGICTILQGTASIILPKRFKNPPEQIRWNKQCMCNHTELKLWENMRVSNFMVALYTSCDVEEVPCNHVKIPYFSDVMRVNGAILL